MKNGEQLWQDIQIIEPEKGNKAPQHPTGWVPVFGSLLGNLREMWASLPCAESNRFSCGSWVGGKQLQNPTAIIHKAHIFM